MHEILAKKLYDAEFLKYWTNAVFLVRKSDNQLIRASDLSGDGKQEDFVVWDKQTSGPILLCSSENRYYAETVSAALKGEYEIVLKDGTPVLCQTAF